MLGTIWRWNTIWGLFPHPVGSLVIKDILGNQRNLICFKLKNDVKWSCLSCVASLHVSVCNLAREHHTHPSAFACLLGRPMNQHQVFNPKSQALSQLKAVLILSCKMEIGLEVVISEMRKNNSRSPWAEGSFHFKCSPGPQVCLCNHK
jgi:hypothetical protein